MSLISRWVHFCELVEALGRKIVDVYVEILTLDSCWCDFLDDIVYYINNMYAMPSARVCQANQVIVQHE